MEMLKAVDMDQGQKLLGKFFSGRNNGKWMLRLPYAKVTFKKVVLCGLCAFEIERNIRLGVGTK
jgi:hypothetical protein